MHPGGGDIERRWASVRPHEGREDPTSSWNVRESIRPTLSRQLLLELLHTRSRAASAALSRDRSTLSVAPGELHAGWTPGPQEAAGGQPEAQHRIPAQRILWSIVGLRARGLGRGASSRTGAARSSGNASSPT